MRREVWWVLALLVLAFLVRWIPAWRPHYWVDEIYTLGMISRTPGQVLSITACDTHPPLFYFWTKCFAYAGCRLGGVFATLAWLRLASIIPGVVTCWLAWRLSRRAWGARCGLWTLAFFALSPALTYYSLDLRNYALTQCLLLAALAGFIRLMEAEEMRNEGEGEGEREGEREGEKTGLTSILLLAGAGAAAVYSHTLAFLYLGAFGAIFLFEWAQARANRLRLFRAGAAAAGLCGLCYLPWAPIVIRQGAGINGATFLGWVHWAEWGDLLSTYLGCLPLGPLAAACPTIPWPIWMMGLVGVGFGLLMISALRAPLPQAIAPNSDHGREARATKLLFYSAVLATLPLLAAFFISYFHIARVFLDYRYNLIAAPFFNLALLGLIFRLPSRRARGTALAAVLTVSAVCSAGLLYKRVANQNALADIARNCDPALLNPANRNYLINPVLLPWLSRPGPLMLEDFGKARSNVPLAGAECFFISNAVTGPGTAFTQSPPCVLENILKQRKASRVTGMGNEWQAIWRLPGADLGAVTAEWKARCRAIEVRRRSIPGGQLVLADDEAFPAGAGWSGLEVNSQNFPQRWTQGTRQRLAWRGPQQPGHYTLKLNLRRPQPYPEKEIDIKYRLPGELDWTTRKIGLGSICLESDVNLVVPRQTLRLEMETPTWIPKERIPGALDPRPLGIVFVSIELRPF